MDISPPKKIKVTHIPGKNRGIVAIEKILKDEIIECCPLIILGKKDEEFVKYKEQSDVLYYYHLQQPDLNRLSIMLGYGSLYNHSLNPNAVIDYTSIAEDKYMIFRAIRDIEIGEEIVYNYKFDYDTEFLPEEYC